MLRSITKNFELILKKQSELNYHFINIIRAPAKSEHVLDTETKLKLLFNDELKELYSFADGTNIDSVTPSGLTGLIPIHNFLSLVDAVFYNQNIIEFKEAFYNSKKNYQAGPKLFPFLEDGAGNCYWVDLNNDTKNYGKIFWTNTFGQEPDYVFESLTIIFQVISDAYITEIITIDKEGFLDCDYKAFEQLCKTPNM